MCPEEDGRWGHPKLPNKFVKCIDGTSFEETCPSNLLFNKYTGMCDLHNNVIVSNKIIILFL